MVCRGFRPILFKHKVPYETDFIHISDEDLRGYFITVHGATIYAR